MARLPRNAQPPAPTPLPGDVRLMNGVATGIYVLAAATVLAAALGWLARSPWFAIRLLQIDGELQRNNLPTLRANALPRLSGNFFSIDLQQARAAFQSVPWVRRAVVRRIWPDRLAVRLEEHRPVALWASDDEKNPLLVNAQGEVFEANVGDVEDDALPVFDGPPGSAAAMWSLYRRLQPLLARQGLAPQRLTLTGRGSWRVETDAGQSIVLGRGSEDELLARCERFVRTLPQVAARFGRTLISADLRHAGGYAVRLEGVTTLAASSSAGSR
jgi:cell division protein FtsQ